MSDLSTKQNLALRTTGMVKDGVFRPFDPVRSANKLKQFEGQIIDVVYQLHEEPKSQNQLGYLWQGIIKSVCMKTEMFGGWTKDEIYEFFCGYFLLDFKELVDVNGEVQAVMVVKSLSRLNKRETAEFIDKIIRWLAEQDIYVPSPDEWIQRKIANG
jgi:hypothetical protein